MTFPADCYDTCTQCGKPIEPKTMITVDFEDLADEVHDFCSHRCADDWRKDREGELIDEAMLAAGL